MSPSFTKGKFLLKQHKSQEALPLFLVAAQQYPSSWEAFFYLGIAQGNLRQFEEAVLSLMKANVINSEEPLIWWAKAQVFRKAGRLSEAIESIDQALVYDPNSAISWLEKGMILLQSNKVEEGLSALDIASSLAPSNIGPLVQKAVFLNKTHRYAEALDVFYRIIEIDDSILWVWNGVLNILIRLHGSDSEIVIKTKRRYNELLDKEINGEK